MSENEQHQQWYDVEINNIRELRYTLVEKALQVIQSVHEKCNFIEQLLLDIKHKDQEAYDADAESDE